MVVWAFFSHMIFIHYITFPSPLFSGAMFTFRLTWWYPRWTVLTLCLWRHASLAEAAEPTNQRDSTSTSTWRTRNSSWHMTPVSYMIPRGGRHCPGQNDAILSPLLFPPNSYLLSRQLDSLWYYFPAGGTDVITQGDADVALDKWYTLTLMVKVRRNCLICYTSSKF